MATDGHRRRRVRDARVDARSRERARQTRRRSRPVTRSGSPVSIIEAGDLGATAAEDALIDAGPDDVGEADEADTFRPERAARRLARSGGARRQSRSYAVWLARVQRIDAKRAVILALVIIVVALTLAMPMRTYFSQRAELRALTASNVEKQRELADYRQKANEQDDPAYIEAKARAELLFVKPGETPLVMMYPGEDERRAAAEAAEKRSRAPWYSRLLESVATPPGVR